MNYVRDHYDANRPRMEEWYHKLLGRDKLYPKEPLILPNEQEFSQIFSKVVEKSPQELLKYRNFGKKSLAEIEELLKGMGLNLAGSAENETSAQAEAA